MGEKVTWLDIAWVCSRIFTSCRRNKVKAQECNIQSYCFLNHQIIFKCTYLQFTVKPKLALAKLILLLALQLYCTASSCSKLQITKMDWTKVTPFSFTSSFKIVDRDELPSGVPSLLQVKDGTGQPCATHTNIPVLPAVIGALSEMITMDVSVRLLICIETGSQWLCYKCSIYTLELSLESAY